MAKWIIPVMTLALLLGCGTQPPATPWDGSRADTLAIQDSIKSMRSRSDTRLYFDADYVLEKDFVPVSIPASIISKFKADTFSQDFFPIAFQKVATEIDTVDSLVFAKDSTCTVSIIFRIKKGIFKVQCDSVTPVKDTVMIGGKPMTVYSNQMVKKDTILTKELHGESWQVAFFDYDTVKQGWRFKKVSGGMEFWFPNIAGAPFLYPVGGMFFFAHNLTSDTIFMRADSLHLGVQGLYPLDSLLTYKVGDTVSVNLISSGVYVYADSVMFQWSDSTRTALGSQIYLTKPGVHTISIEAANAEPFISPKPTATYRSIFCGIPVLVK